MCYTIHSSWNICAQVYNGIGLFSDSDPKQIAQISYLLSD